jgi:hypothetical protein
LKKRRRRQFWKKKKAKKWKQMGKKHMGKIKVEFSTSSIFKKNSTKIILEKNMWGNTIAKQKSCGKTL